MNEEHSTAVSAQRVRRKPVALAMLAGGGFAFETARLVRDLGETFEFVYLRTQFGGEAGKGGLPSGRSRTISSFSSLNKKSMRTSIAAFFSNFLDTLRFIREEKIELIIVVGCSHALPLFLAGRLRGCKTVFVESLARVDRLSNTGKLVYHLRLATTFLVQWPGLLKQYPSARMGSVL